MPLGGMAGLTACIDQKLPKTENLMLKAGKRTIERVAKAGVVVSD